MKPSMNPVLKDFWLTPSRYKILYGGRASSKSWDAAAHTVRLARMVKCRILCLRMFQNKIEESVYNLIKSQAERFGVAHEFTFQKNKITHNITGTEFLFYGIARNINEIKSLEGVDLCWIEEAQSLTETMWDVLEPTIRKEGSEILIVFNPQIITDFVYQHFVVNPPKGALVRKINYHENKFLSKTALEGIEERKERDYDNYLHVYEGEPLTDDDNVIIKRSWLLAAVDAHEKLGIEPDGRTFIGYDVADSGEDKNAAILVKGVLTESAEEWKGREDELLESCQRVWQMADRNKAHVQYDSIGVGAGVGSKFKELNIDRYGEGKLTEPQYVTYTPFNAGGAVVNPKAKYDDGVFNQDFFSNVKAQAWWMIADRLRDTYNAVEKGHDVDPANIISLSSDCEQLEKLITELSTPRRHFDGKGKVKVESKDDLAKRDVKSPNLADAFIMAHWRAPSKKRTLGLPKR